MTNEFSGTNPLTKTNARYEKVLILRTRISRYSHGLRHR
jgi:hypothetical protein